MKPSSCGPGRISASYSLLSVSDRTFYLMVIPSGFCPIYIGSKNCVWNIWKLLSLPSYTGCCKWLVMCGLYRMLKMTATEDENRLGTGEYVLKIYVDISVLLKPSSLCSKFNFSFSRMVCYVFSKKKPNPISWKSKIHQRYFYEFIRWRCISP